MERSWRSGPAGGRGGSGVCGWLGAVLALWAVLSLVVMVVWATWAGPGRCEARRRTLLENTERERRLWETDRRTAEVERRLSAHAHTQLQKEIHNLTRTITHNNQILTQHLYTQVVLKENLSALQNEVQRYEHTVEKLTTEHTHFTELIEELQMSLWSKHLQLHSCSSRCEAVRRRHAAAQSQRKVCEIHTRFLHTQLVKCELGV